MTNRKTPQDQTSADSPLYLVLEPEMTSGAACGQSQRSINAIIMLRRQAKAFLRGKATFQPFSLAIIATIRSLNYIV